MNCQSPVVNDISHVVVTDQNDPTLLTQYKSGLNPCPHAPVSALSSLANPASLTCKFLFTKSKVSDFTFEIGETQAPFSPLQDLVESRPSSCDSELYSPKNPLEIWGV